MRDVTLYSMKNESDQSFRFVHHAKFHCIMITLNKLFKIEFERGELEKSLGTKPLMFRLPFKVFMEKFLVLEKLMKFLQITYFRT